MGKTRRTFIFDGKSLSPWDVDSDTGWTALGATNNNKDIDELGRRVPWLFRAIRDRANNVSHMPWAIEKGADVEVANSEDWAEQKPPELDWLSNPRQLLSQIEQSLIMAGKAYCALELNKFGFIKALNYVNPNSITEEYDKKTGALIGYSRAMSNGQMPQKCSMADKPPVAGQLQLVAIYDPDYLTESGPGKSSAGLAAMTAAGVLFSYDEFVTNYFQKGAIKASILTVDGASVNEQERLQHWWDDVVGGVKNAWSAIVLRSKLAQPVVIGEGLEGVKDNDLSTQRRQDIATALGIPESRLWSAAANYATRKEDEAAYFRGTILIECDLIAEAFNEQVFNAIHNLDGWRIEFQPEQLDIFQEDEAERAASLKQLVDAGIPLMVAMDLLGYDLTDEQEAAIEEASKPKPVHAALAPFAGQPNQPAAPVAQPEQQPPQVDTGPAAMRSALYNWKAASLAAIKTGHTAGVDFDHPAIPDTVAEFLRYELEGAKDANAVNLIFKKARDLAKSDLVDPMVFMAMALNRASDLVEKEMA